MILVELTVDVRPLRNLYLFRAMSDTGGVRGRIEYPRALLLRISSPEWFIFPGAFLLLFVRTKSCLIERQSRAEFVDVPSCFVTITR